MFNFSRASRNEIFSFSARAVASLKISKDSSSAFANFSTSTLDKPILESFLHLFSSLKGFVTFEEVENTHKKMETLLGEQHAYLNGIYYCPHHPEKGFEGEIKELKIECECRKPKAGMLFQAQKDLNIDLGNSWMIGDSQRDIDAGKNAGCKSISIKKDLGADYVAQDLKDAVNYILKGVDNE